MVIVSVCVLFLILLANNGSCEPSWRISLRICGDKQLIPYCSERGIRMCGCVKVKCFQGVLSWSHTMKWVSVSMHPGWLMTHRTLWTCDLQSFSSTDSPIRSMDADIFPSLRALPCSLRSRVSMAQADSSSEPQVPMKLRTPGAPRAIPCSPLNKWHCRFICLKWLSGMFFIWYPFFSLFSM